MSNSRGARIYRLLLRLLPKDFREAHGAEMEALFREALGRAKAKGRIAWGMAWLRGTVDVVMLAGSRRLRELTALWSPNRSTMDKAGTRNASTREWLIDLGQDVRYALRGLAKSKAFTIIAVLSLTIGIGINTTFYTVIHTTMFRPVPGVTGADRVVEVLSKTRGGEIQEWTYPDFLDVREAETPIAELAGWKPRTGSFGGVGGGQPINLIYVSANYFRVLGVTPSRGRGFLPGEDVVPGGHKVVVVSHRMWQGRLDLDPDVIGSVITIDRTAYTIVGVAPEIFRGHRPLGTEPDAWLPLTEYPWMLESQGAAEDRDSYWVMTLGRLRDGATVDGANAALRTVFTRLAAEYPETNADRGARAVSFGPFPALRRTADMLAAGGVVAMVGLVLLVICGNLAGMVLARSATRERELAVRLALGAGRGRLIRQLMTEALVLAAVGGSAGILLAYWAIDFVSSTGMGNVPAAVGYQVNGPVLAYSLVLTLGTTLTFGLFPALRFSRPELVSSLKDDTGGGARRVSRIHKLAAASQTGIALLLLIVCSLFLRAVGLMDRRDLGFEPDKLFVAHIDLTAQGYDDPAKGELFVDRVLESVGAIPGVEQVAVSDGIPLDLIGNFTRVSRPDLSEEEGERVAVEFTKATEGFFPAIGASVLQGRGFRASDKASTEPVVVVTKSLADRLWPGETALGRQLRVPLFQSDNPMHTVVGVVRHVASSVASRDLPHVFLSLRQHYWPQLMVVARGNADLGMLGPTVRDAILAIDPELTPPTLVTSTSLVHRSTETQRMTANAAAGLGALALLLSGIGVYGVVAFAVANRTREIGLRMAMGATRGQVLRRILWDAVRLAVPGLVVGAVLAAAVAALMRAELLGLSPVDPVSFSAAVGVLLVLVLLASFVPARRASAIDPMSALRSE